MAFEELTLDDVKTAYRKLKSIAYYDTYDLFMKAKIASFETETTDDESDILNVELVDFDRRLKELHKALTSSSEQRKKTYWQKHLTEISYRVLPKKIKTFDQYKTGKTGDLISNIFTNEREVSSEEKYDVEKLTFYIDCSIEIHIVSILWIMKLGYILENDLYEKCYGNRLILEKRKANSRLREPLKDEGLFKPYYGQYQKWRDEGISVAKRYLDKKQDVLFINIDIKDYYYSVRLKFDDLQERLEEHTLEGWKTIIEIFNSTHKIYTERIQAVGYPNDFIKDVNEGQTILPIGLTSSYILGNWYLREFDSRVNQNIRPIYYSRYVDDIFIVMANTVPRFTNKESCLEINKAINDAYDSDLLNSLTETEQHIVKTFYPVITLTELPKEIYREGDHPKSSIIFKLSCYENLYVQPSKTLVFLFKHDSSLALLDKFKNELEKRSSEFRFLPDEKLEEDGFDDEAYELIFDDSQYKIKTLKDYKESKYGIASHLSKKIFYSLRNGKKNSKEDAKKILTFFRGTTNFDHFRQWERLVTYFIVNDNKEEFLDFAVNTFEQIFNLPIPGNFKSYNISYLEIVEDLLEYFSIAIEMGLSLNPSFAKPIEKQITETFSRFSLEFMHTNDHPLLIFKQWQRFRWSNMLRHGYINIPLLNYTNVSIQENSSLLECDFSKIHDIDSVQFNEDLIKYSPRKIRFYEVAWMECIRRVYSTPKPRTFQNRIPNDILYKGGGNNIHYLDEAFEIYFRINYWHKAGDRSFKEDLKKEIFQYDECLSVEESRDEQPESLLIAHEITVNSKIKLKKLRIGLANMKVDEKNYELSMLEKPNMKDRYNDFAKVLNISEEERCDLVVLPELSLPHGLVKTIIDHSWKHERAIITGLEHWTHNSVAYNFILTILPCSIRGIKDAVPILRLKNHYAPIEEFWMNDYRKTVPKPDPYRYHLLRWKGLYFTNYYCFELADIIHRAIFRSRIDFLVASEWNADINYYSNITEATARDIHCYFIQVNTSQFGDSRVTKPTKSAYQDSLRIKGGKNTTLLVDELDIEKLREFQYKGFGQQKEDGTFKPTPADYKHEDARKRQENKSFRKKK